MKIGHEKKVTVTLILDDREAKILACLLGAIVPKEAEETIMRSVQYEEWIGKLEYREVTNFTGLLYDSLYDVL